MSESRILAAVRKRLGREPDLVLWRLSYGLTESDGDRYRAGLSVRGGSDLIGVLRYEEPSGYGDGPAVTGRFVAIEVKTPAHLARIKSAIARGATDRLNRTDREQIMFMAVVRMHGGFAAYVDGEDAAADALDRARRGESE